MGLRPVTDEHPTRQGEKITINLWDKATPVLRSEIQTSLLECLRHEHVHQVRKKICDTIADIAQALMFPSMEEEGEPWMELLGVVMDCIKSPSEGVLAFFVA
jgi:hypothetical protein